MDKRKSVNLLKDNYEWDEDGTLYYIVGKSDKNDDRYEEKTKIANHTPLLKEYHKVDNGIDVTEEIEFTVLRNYNSSEPIALASKDIMGQTPNLKFGAACYIEPGRGTVARYRLFLHRQCEQAPIRTVYKHTGYAVIDGDRVFLNGAYSVTKDGLTDKYSVHMKDTLSRYCFTNEKEEDRYKTLLTDLPKIAPKPVVYSALALSFLTPLNALLREIGLEPAFTLYFIGKTGSYKSTIAKIFLNFFGDYAYSSPAPANFKDTPNAIEMKLAVTDSTLMLLDDRIPNATAAHAKRMEAIEQSVARGIGDRVGRSRLNSDMEQRVTPIPKCNLIITAEQAYSNVGESAVARSIAVELPPGTAETLKNITPVQDNAQHLNMCMSEYIQYVITNWDNLKIELKEKYRNYIDSLKVDGHARLTSTIAHLQLGIYMMCEWLKSIGILNDKNSADMQRESIKIFKNLAYEQDKRMADEKPERMFIDAFKELVDTKTIKFAKASDPDSRGLSNAAFCGYYDDNFYYCLPGEIYAVIREHYTKQGINFPLTKQALFKHLLDEHMIDGEAKQTTKKKRIGKTNNRYLWLRKAVIDSEQEGKY